MCQFRWYGVPGESCCTTRWMKAPKSRLRISSKMAGVILLGFERVMRASDRSRVPPRRSLPLARPRVSAEERLEDLNVLWAELGRLGRLWLRRAVSLGPVHEEGRSLDVPVQGRVAEPAHDQLLRRDRPAATMLINDRDLAPAPSM